MSATSPALLIRLLGRFEVERAGQLIPPAEWRGQKTRDLLKSLILSHGHYLANDQIYDRLWPDTPIDAAQNNLRAVVSDLRKILEPNLQHGRDSQYILTRHEGYTFDLNPNVWLDTLEFERLADSPAPTDLETAISLYRGDLLEEDLYADWTVSERQRLQSVYLTLLARQSDLLLKGSAYAQCIEMCERALARDASQEGFWRTLMQAQSASGNRAAALATFQRCRAALIRDLGVDPSPETITLHGQLLRENQPAIISTLPSSVSPQREFTVPIWLKRLGVLGFALWAIVTGLSFSLTVAGLIQGIVISPGDPGNYALPFLSSHPSALADLNRQLCFFFPTGWLLIPGYLVWFQYLRRAQPSLAWLGLSAGILDALTQTLGQVLGLAQLSVLPAAYLTAPASQQLTLITIWDLMRQFASIAGTISLVANPLAFVLLLWASRTQTHFPKLLVYLGLGIILATVSYYFLPDGPLTLIIGIGLTFGLRFWLLVWAKALWEAH